MNSLKELVIRFNAYYTHIHIFIYCYYYFTLKMCLRTLIQLRIFEFFGLAVANLAKRKQYHDNVTFLNLFGKFSFILQSLLAVESKSVFYLLQKYYFCVKVEQIWPLVFLVKPFLVVRREKPNQRKLCHENLIFHESIFKYISLGFTFFLCRRGKRKKT